jgi:hypothetical protein
MCIATSIGGPASLRRRNAIHELSVWPPAWSEQAAATIRRRDVAALLDKIVNRGAAVQANRTRSIAHRLFAFAVEREIVEFNPVTDGLCACRAATAGDREAIERARPSTAIAAPLRAPPQPRRQAICRQR